MVILGVLREGPLWVGKGWGGADISRLPHCSEVLAFFLMYEPHLSCSAPLHTAQRPVSNAGGVGTSGESTKSAFQEDGSQQ